jgi:hypothetical protein
MSRKSGRVSRVTRWAVTRSPASAMSLKASRMKISETISNWLAMERVV